MNKHTLLTIAAIGSILIALAIPTYNSLRHDSSDLLQDTSTHHDISSIQQDTGSPAKSENTTMASDSHWHCVTRTGPDAPNLIVLQNNGQFLKLIDHTRTTRKGTQYDLQGTFEIKQERLVASISSATGEVFTDTYTVKSSEPGEMQLTRSGGNSENSEMDNTEYRCRILANKS